MIFIENQEIKKKLLDILDSFKQDDRFCVDRIENEYAVLEKQNDEKIYNVPLCNLPKDIKEKDVLIYKDNEFKLDEKLTDKRKKELTKDLWL